MLRPSRGTVIPPEVRNRVLVRDGATCVCDRAGFPPEANRECWGSPVELDHVRASGGIGMKSPSTEENLVCLSAPCHRWKTEHGREARPLLLEYLRAVSA